MYINKFIPIAIQRSICISILDGNKWKCISSFVTQVLPQLKFNLKVVFKKYSYKPYCIEEYEYRFIYFRNS